MGKKKSRQRRAKPPEKGGFEKALKMINLPVATIYYIYKIIQELTK